MILNYIELENIRSYDKERIDFPRGITLFEGDIGSGKSTVLMGIEFALFGLGSQKPESLLSKKASEGSVILEFEIDEKRYVIKRKLRRKGDSVSQDAKDSYLISDGQTEPLSPAELKQRVLQVLKFNEPSDPRSESRIFRYAVFTPQEEMKQILRDVQKRLETIRKAFGVEDYKTILDNAKSLSQTIKEKMAEAMVRFEKLDEDEQSLAKLLNDVEELESEISKLNLQKSQLEEKKLETKKELDLLKHQVRQKERLELDVEKIQDQVKNKKSLVSKLESGILRYQKEILEIDSDLERLGKIISPTTKTLSEIDDQISRLSDLRDVMRDKKSKLGSLESDLEKLTKQLGENADLQLRERDKLQKELDDIRTKKESVQNEYDSITKHRIELEKEKRDVMKMLDGLKGLGAKCPHCEHELTVEHKQKVGSEKQSKLREIEGVLGQIEAKTRDLLTALETLKSDESKKDEKIRQIDRIAPLRDQWFEKNQVKITLLQDITTLESGYVITEEPSFPNGGDDALSYLRKMKDAQKEFLLSKQKLSDLESRKNILLHDVDAGQVQIDSENAALSKLDSDLQLLSRQLSEFSELAESVEQKEREHSDLDSRIDSTKTSLIKHNQMLETGQSKIKEMQTSIVESKSWKEKHTKFSNYHDWLKEFFIPTIDRIEKQVLLSIQQNFNEIYRKWYSVLIDDVTKESRINEEFTPLVEQDGFEQDVDFLSGGEKTSIALAYRLTLNSMMRQESEGLKSNLLILDEPTDGFSKAQLSKVRNLLYELKSQQIILVSHEKELETYVDNIFQITKDSGVSKVMRLSN